MCNVPHHGTPLDSPIARAVFTATRPSVPPPSFLGSVSSLISFFFQFFLRCSSILSFVALRDDTFSTDPFWLCSRLSFYMVAAEPAITTRRSAHSRTDHSETDSLPATRPILPTVLSELLFQRPQSQGLPRLRGFVTAVFSHGYDYPCCPFLYRPPPASWSRALL